MITLRFDMRAPATAAPTTKLYAAAIEMCAWGPYPENAASAAARAHNPQ